MMEKIIELRFQGVCLGEQELYDILCKFDANTKVIAVNIQKREELLVGKLIFTAEGYSGKTKESIDYLKSLGLRVKMLEKIA